MDNQQATSWFVGILEGEGSFSKSDFYNREWVRISNTDLEIINKCVDVLNQLRITNKTSRVSLPCPDQPSHLASRRRLL